MAAYQIDEFLDREMLKHSKVCVHLASAVYGPYLRHDEWVGKFEEEGDEGIEQVHTFLSPNRALVISVACFHKAKIAYVVCRGTNVRNWSQICANAKATKIEEPVVGQVHKGVREELDMVWEAKGLWNCLKGLIDSGYLLYYTGHSQGGGLATLAAARHGVYAFSISDRSKLPAGLTTFGSMRVFDQRGSYFVERCFVDVHEHNNLRFPVMRWRNNNDLVTIAPPSKMGYRHVGEDRVLYIKPNGNVSFNPPKWLRGVYRARAIVHNVYVAFRYWRFEIDALRDHLCGDPSSDSFEFGENSYCGYLLDY